MKQSRMKSELQHARAEVLVLRQSLKVLTAYCDRHWISGPEVETAHRILAAHPIDESTAALMQQYVEIQEECEPPYVDPELLTEPGEPVEDIWAGDTDA